MYRLADGTTKLLEYEDIVVKAFRLFPNDFALRGYSEYPDSSDLHKSLYGPLKRGGLVRSGNKKFGLTPRGVEAARSLESVAGTRIEEPSDARRLTRDQETELTRMLNSAAFKLFAQGKRKSILDTDFYGFVGCTVRTPRNDFLGRLEATHQAVVAAVQLETPDRVTAELLASGWDALRDDFAKIISAAGATTSV
jgi:hypothetical protein